MTKSNTGEQLIEHKDWVCAGFNEWNESNTSERSEKLHSHIDNAFVRPVLECFVYTVLFAVTLHMNPIF